MWWNNKNSAFTAVCDACHTSLLYCDKCWSGLGCTHSANANYFSKYNYDAQSMTFHCIPAISTTLQFNKPSHPHDQWFLQRKYFVNLSLSLVCLYIYIMYFTTYVFSMFQWFSFFLILEWVMRRLIEFNGLCFWESRSMVKKMSFQTSKTALENTLNTYCMPLASHLKPDICITIK